MWIITKPASKMAASGTTKEKKAAAKFVPVFGHIIKVKEEDG